MIILVLFLNRIPYVKYVFKTASTMFHEFGHAFMALFTSGRINKIYLFSNNSGMAVTSTKNWLSRVLVALAGYPFEVLVAFCLVYLYAHEAYTSILYLFIGVSVFTFIFIRNLYGFLWLSVFIAVNVWMTMQGNYMLTKYYLLLIVLSVFIEMIISNVNILIISVRTPKNDSDASALARLTKIPAGIWGCAFLGFAVYAIYQLKDYVGVLFTT